MKIKNEIKSAATFWKSHNKTGIFHGQGRQSMILNFEFRLKCWLDSKVLTSLSFTWDVDFKHFGKIIQTFKIFQEKKWPPFHTFNYLILSPQRRGKAGLLIPCTNRPVYLPRFQQGFWQWFRPLRRGGAGVRTQPPSWAKYFKIMQFFTRNWAAPLTFVQTSGLS